MTRPIAAVKIHWPSARPNVVLIQMTPCLSSLGHCPMELTLQNSSSQFPPTPIIFFFEFHRKQIVASHRGLFLNQNILLQVL
jgi:hypothetical protein